MFKSKLKGQSARTTHKDFDHELESSGKSRHQSQTKDACFGVDWNGMRFIIYLFTQALDWRPDTLADRETLWSESEELGRVTSRGRLRINLGRPSDDHEGKLRALEPSGALM